MTAGGQPIKIASATTALRPCPTMSRSIDGNSQTGWSVNGGQGRRHTAVFRLAQPLAAEAFDVKMLFERHFACPLGRFRISVTDDASPAEANEFPDDVAAALQQPFEKLDAPIQQRVRQYFVSTAPELVIEATAIEHLRRTMPTFPTTLVFQQRPAVNPRQTFVHKRGEFLQTTERVEPGVLPVVGSLSPGAQARPAGLAGWLVSPANPLVGRVTMNRQWAVFFGRGLVRTTEDFGYQGELPTHPELLDWLAVELPRRGWSLKQMHRLIVTSATYQQDSRVTPTLLCVTAQRAARAADRVAARGRTGARCGLEGGRAVVEQDRRTKRLSAATKIRDFRRDVRRRWPGPPAWDLTAIAAACTLSRSGPRRLPCS